MSAIVYLLVFGLALYGGHRVLVKFYAKNKGCSEEEAKKQVNSFLLDQVLPSKSYDLLNDGIFVSGVIEDIRLILSEEDFLQWQKLQNRAFTMMMSERNGALPCYGVMLKVPEDVQKLAFEQALIKRVKETLLSNGYSDKVFGEWKFVYYDNQKIPNWYWFVVRYATTKEEVKAMDSLYSREQNIVADDVFGAVIDKELERELLDIGDPED